MLLIKRVLGSLPACLFVIMPATGSALQVPNPSFEVGRRTPAGWTLEGSTGHWLKKGAAAGKRAIAVTGSGEDNSYWRSDQIAFEPSAVYQLRFRARKLDGSGGTPVTGPVFCNRDLGGIPAEWQSYTSIFTVPVALDDGNNWLRFGQWHMTGSVAFDDIQIERAAPIYRKEEDLTLGEGETVSGQQYEFLAPFGSISRNHSRPLASHRCGFNTHRWVFGAGSEVVYRHRVGSRRQTAATVGVTVNYYVNGELVVEASKRGRKWTELGIINRQAGGSFPLPASLLPAKEIWIRLRARSRQALGPDSDPGSFQVNMYHYQATLEGPPVEVQGATRFVTVTKEDPRLKVAIQSLGEGLPGERNVIVTSVTNLTKQPITARPVAAVTLNGQEQMQVSTSVVLKPGAQQVRIPYQVSGSGQYDLRLSFGGDITYQAQTSFRVAELYNASYGNRLPASSDAVALWWTSSGWKISQTRPPPGPEAATHAMVIRAARNETEAAQLVIRPAQALREFTIKPGILKGPQDSRIRAREIDVLRVRYVNVTKPTDATSVAAPWPDPLPPLTKPLDLSAGDNQPFWVRVHVPRNAKAGIYLGTLTLRAHQYRAEVPISVEVFDFELPDRMSCVTAFGFSPGNVWRYQKITDPAQRRKVLDKYLTSLGAHHISPYDPVPLDPFQINWPQAGEWSGGMRDREEKHAGKSSLFVEDASSSSQPSAHYSPIISIPARGLNLKFWYKTKIAGQQFIVALNHFDRQENWMTGRNNNFLIEGDGTWRPFDQTVTDFPEGAKSVRLTLYASVWADDGTPTGAVWYDEVSLTDAGTGKELLKGGGFEPLPPKSLKPEIDWTAWDKAMEIVYDRYHFNSFALPIPGMGGGTFHARYEPSLLGYREHTPEYQTAFRACVGAMQEHLRRKGWLKDAFVYWFDEPDPKDYEFVMNGFKKLKEAGPGIQRMLTEQPESELVGGPNLWCPVTPEYNHVKAEERRQAGEKFWWYVCTWPTAPYTGLFIDHPATELRVWLWQTWKRKIDGILIWQTNYWTSNAAYPDPDHPQNPYEDPMGWTSGYSTPAGTKSPWGNGDGRFIYPPEAAASGRQAETVLDGPVDSIRLEMLRDGIEDYEYLAILRRLLNQHGSKLAKDKRKDYAALLEVPEDITKSLTSFTKDPTPIESRRRAIAQAIEELAEI